VPERGAGAAVWLPFGIEPVKMLSNRLKGPPPLEDCARASPPSNNAAATIAVPVNLLANDPVRRIMSHPVCPKYPAFRRPCHGFQ
jgi:hypothetical protein